MVGIVIILTRIKFTSNHIGGNIFEDIIQRKRSNLRRRMQLYLFRNFRLNARYNTNMYRFYYIYYVSLVPFY